MKSKENWEIDLKTGMMKRNGKDTGVSFAKIVTSPSFQEIISNEIDAVILDELLGLSRVKEAIQKEEVNVPEHIC